MEKRWEDFLLFLTVVSPLLLILLELILFRVKPLVRIASDFQNLFDLGFSIILKTRNESQKIPAWILANRFASTSHLKAIIEVDKQYVTKFPILVEALKKADETEELIFPHPYELIESTNYEARRIIKLLGGKYSSSRKDYPFDIKFDDKLYSISITFSLERPMIA
jgi:hypothetical protein